jgi:hypothetical protein
VPRSRPLPGRPPASAGGRAARDPVLLRSVAAAAALLAAACARGPERVHVVSLSLAEGALAAPFRAEGIDAGALDGAARDGLAGAGFPLGDGSRPHRALLVVREVRALPPAAGDGRRRAEVAVEVVLAPTAPGAGPPLREAASAAVPLAVGGTAREAWLSAFRQAAQRAAEGLALAVAAGDKPVGALLADVGADDPRVREQAVRVLGERRTPDAVPVLIARLEKEEPRLAHRILGALAQIGDPRAVPALIDASRSADAALTARLARYIGDIGGAEAEGYLLTLASGHADRRVRKAAQEALDDMRARAEAPVAARK